MKNLLFIGSLLLSHFVIAQQQTISEITFEGLHRVDESLLRRLLKSKELQPYDSLKVATDVARLNRLPAIANASVSKKHTADSSYQLRYRIVENFTIIPGLRISEANDGSFAFRVSVFEFNFLGQSQIIGGFYQRDVFNSYGAYWEAPFLITNKMGLGVNFIKEVTFEPIYFTTSTVNYQKKQASAAVYGLYEFDFHNKAELGVTLSKEEYTFDDTSVDSTLPNNLNADKITLRAEYDYNFLDIEYQYVSGFQNIVDLRLVTGGTGLLNDTFIGKNTAAYYKRVGARGNWASRLQIGIASFNQSEFAPFTIDNQFNLRGAGNDIDRGTGFIFLNTEYRHTLLEKDWFVIQGNAFVDAGNLRQPRGDFNELVSIPNTEVYSGLGVRFIHKRIFNAVVRLDYGFGIGRSTNRGLVFGIGQYF